MSKPIVKGKRSESSVHSMVARYLRLQYPKVIFHTDFAAGIKMTMGQAVKNASLQSGKSWPDLFIPEPRNGKFGLFLEIKSSVDKVYKKDMTYKKDEHVEAQAAMLEKLQERNFAAYFGCGFDHCKRIIDEYMAAENKLQKE